MVLEFLGSWFLAPLGLLALLTLVPLIIIYLIKEKPHVQFFPSVRFLMRKKKHRFLPNISRFIKDPLFLLQLLVLVLLSAALAQPYIMVPERSAGEQTLIILDASASMQASFRGGTRFDEAREVASSYLGDRTTIILVGEFPELLVEDADRRQAERLLGSAQPKDTITNLYDAVILADDFIESGDAVVVISDFLHTANEKSVQSALDVIRSKGIRIILEPVREPVDNVGIVDVDVRRNTTVVRVKNYANRTMSGSLGVGDARVPLQLGQRAAETFDIGGTAGTSEIRLSVDDGFRLDNVAYVSRPPEGEIRALYMTNSRDLYLYTALRLIDGVTIDVAEPPVIESYEYDIIVVKNVEPAKMVPSIVQGLRNRAEEGATVIVVGSAATVSGMDELLGFASVRTSSELQQSMQAEPSSITEDVDFGLAKAYYTAGAEGVLVTVNGEPVISLQPRGTGKVMVYGLEDADSTFQYELLYPVFWKRVVSFVTNRQDVKALNVHTGQILASQGTTVVDPDGNALDAQSLVAEQAGVYVFQEKSIAANVANERESDVNGDVLVSAGVDEQAVASNELVPKDVAAAVLVAVLLLVIIELLYVKFRGDI